MNKLQIIFIALYVFDVTLCLVTIRRKSSPGYAATKPLLMPLLCAVYFSLLPQSLRGENNQIYIALTLLLHALGDFFLLFPRNKTMKFFYTGMISFFAGHIMYVNWFIRLPIRHNIWCSIIALVCGIFFESYLFRQLMAGPRKYAPKLLPYSLGLVAVTVSIASTFGAVPLLGSVLSFAGILLFGFSDYCIFRRMVRLPLFGQMVVMSTYIAGQSLIIGGALLMQVL